MIVTFTQKVEIYLMDICLL